MGGNNGNADGQHAECGITTVSLVNITIFECSVLRGDCVTKENRSSAVGGATTYRKKMVLMER